MEEKERNTFNTLTFLKNKEEEEEEEEEEK
jgi:hypothetical protein